MIPVELGNCVNILSGFAFKSKNFSKEGIMLIIRIRDVKRGYSKTFYSGDYDKSFVINNGDLLIGMDGEFNSSFWSGGKALLNQRVCRIAADGTSLHQLYLFYFLPKELKRIEDTTPAVTVKHLSVKKIKEIKILLPPLDEQRRIAAILEKADSLRIKAQQAITECDEFLKSTFLYMFGDPVSNPKGWDMVTIRDLVDEVKYGSSSKAGPTGEYPMLRMGNITYSGGWDFSALKYIDLSEKDQTKYIVENGDILFNRTNSRDLVGKTAVFREAKPMAYAGYLIRVRSNKDNHTEFISAFLNSDYMKSYLRDKCKSIVGMANINAQELQDFKIMRVPHELQLDYANIVYKTEEIKAQMQQQLDELNDAFNGLMQRAFKGEL